MAVRLADSVRTLLLQSAQELLRASDGPSFGAATTRPRFTVFGFMSSIQLVGFRQRSARSLQQLGMVLLLALLAGCEGDVTIDMSTEQPADPNITQVVANVRGLEFTGGSGTETLEFRDAQQFDFMDYADDDNTLRLFTSEELPEGRYTGVRLLLDTDQDDDEAFVTVVGTNGGSFPMNVVAGDYASIDFEFEDNDNQSEAITLMLDLRQSLSFDDDNDEYTFTPVLRAVRTEDISSIEGNLTVTCPAGDSLIEGAVYLFQGENITPDDLDGAGVEPFATAPVLTGNNNSSFFYSLRVLPQGNYTMAVTCNGNDDDPASDEDLRFRNIVNVELDEGEVLNRNLP
jgi:uncharacterized protein YfaP (DUF2135 family)